ncbi:hypothetical protein BC826DRAFT_369818 [Russula brevipes]|nr:hypothetical protein BC826DRAFT_369818 [Russula brevipes]
MRSSAHSKITYECEKNATENQNLGKLSHTVTPRTHRRLCPFGVGVIAVKRKLRVIHPRKTI